MYSCSVTRSGQLVPGKTAPSAARRLSPARPLPAGLRHQVELRVSRSRIVSANHGRFSVSKPAAGRFTVHATSSPTAEPPVSSTGTAATYDCVVVGAGVSGLCTAHRLVNRHGSSCPSVLVTESRERVGGNVTTMSENGYLWEEGPNSFQPSDAVLGMAVDLGIEKELVFGDPKAPRFVYWDKKLRPTPSGPDVLTFDLLSLWGKIRAGLGAAGILKGPKPDTEESVESFVRRNLGDEVYERLIEPFCSGVYAGNPANLSMKASFGKVWDLEEKGGSIVGGALKLMSERKANPPPPRDPRLPPKPAGQTVASFKKGIQMLPQAAEAALSDKIRLNWRLTAISKEGELFVLTYDTPDGGVSIRARSVAITAPSYVVADLLKEQCAEAAKELSSFDYPPVAAVTLSYPLSAFKEERFDENGNMPGFGQLHPRSQGVVTLGTLYSGTLFPDRCPEGRQMLLNFFGGATNRKVLEQSEEEIIKQIDLDLRREGMILKEDAPAPEKVGFRLWPRAIPQFNIGHLDTVARAKAALADAGWEGLHLGGNYVCGVALGKCVEYADEYSQAISTYLTEKAAAK
eukprot:CAMPEP_0117682508 /NCGR_PEP_ID=MMETSP0804-20121206/19706_1 /TAXON_ID=1074897 /ORGANISM="Tetraselmis astigmatica, Strain CCMP880" /LENGTH=573 /DNA_ID=CAMNT_0005492643 /DNA_START=52 /DNA_END=1773 /DNA_ORIENTATION=+